MSCIIGSNANTDVKSNLKVVEVVWKGMEYYLFHEKYAVFWFGSKAVDAQ